MNEEMTLTPVDYLLRRTNHLLFHHDTINDVKKGVINEMARYFEWSDEEREAQAKKLQETIDEASLTYLK